MTKHGEKIAAFKWHYRAAEYKMTFSSKTSENISCGPLGLHINHWKENLESTLLMRVHAFHHFFTYERWEVSWNCMIQKKDEL